TAHKKRILDFLSQHEDNHFSIDEITAGLSGSGEPVPKSTVYRQVSQLLQQGIVRRFETAKRNRFVYQYVSGSDDCDHHFHLKCVKCGLLIHMDCRELKHVQHHVIESHAFIIGSDRSVIYGACTHCGKGNIQP
ncbi:MAG TPA: transcriptional repressor, partial [Clostridiales bacterium]|nr:transcriptional repressor [Clostridiales bacterium]